MALAASVGVVAGAVSFHTPGMKANTLRIATLVCGALAVASCADSRVIPAQPQSTAARPQTSYQGAPSRPASNAVPAPKGWADFPATPGDWQWTQQGGQSTARFAGGRLVLRCDPARGTVRLERGDGAPTGATVLRVITQTQTRQFTAVPAGGALGIDIPARDNLLDAMAFSKGRFAIETTGLPTLYVPSWTEVSRVVEDCR